ncbi:hypothetical protein P5673_001852 [Acropora cervicornis]|uniref:Uncharacterized protein n=1 Tax=Acropora cervicornis TaxID=6130 RepID=A0AAD9VG94_ACRCE|nr:hypothetical protein P5673_001852 [Acropora cervicornis]
MTRLGLVLNSRDVSRYFLWSAATLTSSSCSQQLTLKPAVLIDCLHPWTKMTWGVNSSMADVTQGKNLSASGKGLNIIHDYYYHFLAEGNKQPGVNCGICMCQPSEQPYDSHWNSVVSINVECRHDVTYVNGEPTQCKQDHDSDHHFDDNSAFFGFLNPCGEPNNDDTTHFTFGRQGFPSYAHNGKVAINCDYCQCPDGNANGHDQQKWDDLAVAFIHPERQAPHESYDHVHQVSGGCVNQKPVKRVLSNVTSRADDMNDQ